MGTPWTKPVVGQVTDDRVGPGLRQPSERLAGWREREEVAREIVIELARYRRHTTDCVWVIFASEEQQRLQPADAGALVFQRRRQPLLHDALRIGRTRVISRAQENRVEMTLELRGHRTRDVNLDSVESQRCAVVPGAARW